MFTGYTNTLCALNRVNRTDWPLLYHPVAACKKCVFVRMCTPTGACAPVELCCVYVSTFSSLPHPYSPPETRGTAWGFGGVCDSVWVWVESDLWPLTFTQRTFEEQDLQFPEHWAFLVSIIILFFTVALAAPRPSRKPPVPTAARPCSQNWAGLSQDYIYHGHFFDVHIKLLS